MATPVKLPPSRPLSSEARRAPVSAELPSQKPGELSAVNRLFADAKQARREHRDAEALSLLEQLLAKYPHSVLAHEASIERFRALARLGRTADAKRHAAAHLARYPGGYAEAEAKRIVGSSETP